jgi:hypothetical protein
VQPTFYSARVLSRLASKLHKNHQGDVSKVNSAYKDTPMGLSAILIATALSLTMLVAVTDLPG